MRIRPGSLKAATIFPSSPYAPPWLQALTNTQLHRLAVWIGAACSGTKEVRLRGIEDTVRRWRSSTTTTTTTTQKDRPLSLVSVDMGVRNLAYAHFTAQREPGDRFRSLELRAWRRMDVADVLESSSPPVEKLTDSVPTPASASSSFDPSLYASYALGLVTHLVTSYRPTHVLIERQRFRTAGGAAVQEWSIRVGVLEGMLYAVFHTLSSLRESRDRISVHPMQPARVNRYWLETSPLDQPGATGPGPKIAGREVKKAKVDVVGRMLSSALAVAGSDDLLPEPPFRLHPYSVGALSAAEAFLTTWRKNPSSKSSGKGHAGNPSNSSPAKLDDLADCLLQGLAWVQWQNNIETMQRVGKNVLDSGIK